MVLTSRTVAFTAMSLSFKAITILEIKFDEYGEM